MSKTGTIWQPQFSVPWVHMVSSSGFRFVLSHGTRVDMQIPAPHSEEFPYILPHKQHGGKSFLLVCDGQSYDSQKYTMFKLFKISGKTSTFLTSLSVLLVGNTNMVGHVDLYPRCIAWEITAPSGATQIGYPGYWEFDFNSSTML